MKKFLINLVSNDIITIKILALCTSVLLCAITTDSVLLYYLNKFQQKYAGKTTC